MEMMNTMNLKYETIRPKSEKTEDLFGRLLEQYVPGTTYDKETGLWHMPEEIRREIKRKADEERKQKI